MTTFHIPDMSCGHCKAAITDALERLGEVTFSFDMDAREVQLDGLEPAAVIDALDEIGFPTSVR
ncbi:copper chaperone [Aliiroseovarius halocynthiae]|uniref:Heavy-metal-associated domain-containing protein n=1 Tax=Aliiroseovarius halocynthiae TaxID=985055 RepID=A0A545SRL7_9RHOB|nr:heavy-metal-associated domain-containing protein [Aliiroseovarius halocynthiae]TQV67602.1 heavy-metal-associated domain-containing protein [Aliiroseovarius halocynthiae]SMR81621.1 copper chaperone [Aliiroseovarius halocynthiae]